MFQRIICGVKKSRFFHRQLFFITLTTSKVLVMLLTNPMEILERFLNQTSRVLLSVLEDFSVGLSISQFIQMKGTECIIYSSIACLSDQSLSMAVMLDSKLSGFG